MNDNNYFKDPHVKGRHSGRVCLSVVLVLALLLAAGFLTGMSLLPLKTSNADSGTVVFVSAKNETYLPFCLLRKALSDTMSFTTKQLCSPDLKELPFELDLLKKTGSNNDLWLVISPAIATRLGPVKELPGQGTIVFLPDETATATLLHSEFLQDRTGPLLLFGHHAPADGRLFEWLSGEEALYFPQQDELLTVYQSVNGLDRLVIGKNNSLANVLAYTGEIAAWLIGHGDTAHMSPDLIDQAERAVLLNLFRLLLSFLFLLLIPAVLHLLLPQREEPLRGLTASWTQQLPILVAAGLITTAVLIVVRRFYELSWFNGIAFFFPGLQGWLILGRQRLVERSDAYAQREKNQMGLPAWLIVFLICLFSLLLSIFAGAISGLFRWMFYIFFVIFSLAVGFTYDGEVTPQEGVFSFFSRRWLWQRAIFLVLPVAAFLIPGAADVWRFVWLLAGVVWTDWLAFGVWRLARKRVPATVVQAFCWAGLLFLLLPF